MNGTNQGKSRGRFIALEGGEGAGKSTQAGLMAQGLRKLGLDVDVTREPGGTPGAEAIRTLLLSPPGEGWGAKAEALLFAAARADHVAQRIVPALDRGTWVICDRFVDSSRAYQGGAGGLGDEAITALHSFGSDGLRPDLTILLEVDEEHLAQRLAVRDGDVSDAIGGRGIEYHRAVAKNFLTLTKVDPKAFCVIDGTGTQEAVHAKVMASVEPLLSDEAGRN